MPITAARNPRIKAISILEKPGVRPRFNPDGTKIIYDKRGGANDYYNLWLRTVATGAQTSLTDGVTPLVGLHGDSTNPPGLPMTYLERNNGNARWHPTDPIIVFSSEGTTHYGAPHPESVTGDPGIGLFANLIAVNPLAAPPRTFTQLTYVWIKQVLWDNVPVFANVNAFFNPAGTQLVWTQRYGDLAGSTWGLWRIVTADWNYGGGTPWLSNERVLYTPPAGNYVTAMEYLDETHLLVAGNLDGQSEVFMNQYVLDLSFNGLAQRITHGPLAWEEGSAIAPNGYVIYQSSKDSKITVSPTASTFGQKVTREYYVTKLDGSPDERLTYFNDPDAPEYLGLPVHVANLNISRDGRFIVGTLGVDVSDDPDVQTVELRVVLIELAKALL